ncbi:hypothetical protein M569_03200 [Genlisea aurea]|uniref:Uncharacterized protein n=1 Tax=Genlisea aurea TaxID=192259 RepID=S8CXA3_9LAMI|nr:hypothetical protein M569_03200 [Genlisea aurea]
MSIRYNAYRRRDFSGEIDVFDAARYFAVADDHGTTPVCAASHVAVGGASTAVTLSLDCFPMRSNVIRSTDLNRKPIKKLKQQQQPDSPGVRVANFLKSFFVAETPSRKTKSGQNAEDTFPVVRRLRSSSFGFTSTKITDVSASETNEFPRKNSYQESRNSCDKHRFSKANWMDRFPVEKHNSGLGFTSRVAAGKPKNNDDDAAAVQRNQGLRSSQPRKITDGEDDGGGSESDTSSDLFDLPNHDLRGGLPIYETTKINYK